MKYLKIILIFLMLLVLTVPAFCAWNPWGQTDLNPLLSRELPIDLMYTGTARGGTSTIVSQVSKLSSTNLAFGLLKLSGAEKTFTLAAGELRQEITLVKSEYDARSLVLSFAIDNPDTAHTGFTSVTWPTEAGGFVTLLWLDDTNGWIITGSYGVTITY